MQVAVSLIALTLPPARLDSERMRPPEAVALNLTVERRGHSSAQRNAGRQSVVRILLAIVFVGSVVVSVTIPLLSAESQIWDGYYLLINDERSEDSPVERAFDGSLRGDTAVKFTVFDGFSKHPADRLASRLDPLDPRFDPFLRAVPDFFAVTDSSGHFRSVTYLRTDLPPAGLLLRLAVSSPAAVLEVLDFDVRRRLLAAAMVAVIVLVEAGVLFAAGRLVPGIVAGGMMVPWLVATLNAGGVAVIAAAAVLPALRRITGGPPQAFGGIVAIIVVVSASFLLGGVLAGLAVSVAAAGSVAAAASRWSAWQATSAGAQSDRRTGNLVLAGLLVALAAVIATAGAFVPAVRVPAPDAGGGGITWDGLARLGLWEPDRGGLPTAADYVTHVAFQEGLQYGRPYRLPTEGEHLTVSSFRFDANAPRLLRRERVLVTYDGRWLERVRAEAIGAGRLLIEAGAVSVKWKRLSDLVGPSGQRGAMILLALLSGGAAVGAVLRTRSERAAR